MMAAESITSSAVREDDLFMGRWLNLFYSAAVFLWADSEEVRKYFQAEFTEAGIRPAANLSDVPATVRDY